MAAPAAGPPAPVPEDTPVDALVWYEHVIEPDENDEQGLPQGMPVCRMCDLRVKIYPGNTAERVIAYCCREFNCTLGLGLDPGSLALRVDTRADEREEDAELLRGACAALDHPSVRAALAAGGVPSFEMVPAATDLSLAPPPAARGPPQPRQGAAAPPQQRAGESGGASTPPPPPQGPRPPSQGPRPGVSFAAEAAAFDAEVEREMRLLDWPRPGTGRPEGSNPAVRQAAVAAAEERIARAREAMRPVRPAEQAAPNNAPSPCCPLGSGCLLGATPACAAGAPAAPRWPAGAKSPVGAPGPLGSATARSAVCGAAGFPPIPAPPTPPPPPPAAGGAAPAAPPPQPPSGAPTPHPPPSPDAAAAERMGLAAETLRADYEQLSRETAAVRQRLREAEARGDELELGLYAATQQRDEAEQRAQCEHAALASASEELAAARAEADSLRQEVERLRRQRDADAARERQLQGEVIALQQELTSIATRAASPRSQSPLPPPAPAAAAAAAEAGDWLVRQLREQEKQAAASPPRASAVRSPASSGAVQSPAPFGIRAGDSLATIVSKLTGKPSLGDEVGRALQCHGEAGSTAAPPPARDSEPDAALTVRSASPQAARPPSPAAPAASAPAASAEHSPPPADSYGPPPTLTALATSFAHMAHSSEGVPGSDRARLLHCAAGLRGAAAAQQLAELQLMPPPPPPGPPPALSPGRPGPGSPGGPQPARRRQGLPRGKVRLPPPGMHPPPPPPGPPPGGFQSLTQQRPPHSARRPGEWEYDEGPPPPPPPGPPPPSSYYGGTRPPGLYSP
eukprot:TRINITY_DN19789_c1_g1_i1.p1 TRINITY_DN19789_c1_g1~~TRINITY_DN19789_c1_g1_i1.p1  ORF type:complete len:821 (+),score=241.19 TRINITY_DN19789_c1_g1_i1:71-2464(+)